MRNLLLVIAVLLAIGNTLARLGAEMHTFAYKDGNLKSNNEEVDHKIFGDMTIEWAKNGMNFSLAQGITEEGTKIPFYFDFRVTNFANDSGQLTVQGTCHDAAWGRKVIKAAQGDFTATGTWESMNFKGNCTDPAKVTASASATSYVFNFNAVKYPHNRFCPDDAAARAIYLIGEPRSNYLPSQVLSYAIFGYPYISVLNTCAVYLRTFGVITNETKPGYVIIGKDGIHCAIIDKEADHFIHSNPLTKLVTLHPLSLLSQFFRAGWVIKSFAC